MKPLRSKFDVTYKKNENQSSLRGSGPKFRVEDVNALTRVSFDGLVKEIKINAPVTYYLIDLLSVLCACQYTTYT